MATKKRGPSNILLYILMAMSGAVVGVLVMYIKFAPADKVPPELHIQDKPALSRRIDAPKVYKPVYRGDNLDFEHRNVKTPDGENPQVFAVNEFLDQSGIVEKSARLLSIDVKDGTARLDFNPTFKQTYGTMDEKTLLDGICKTLGQFPEISKLEFYEGGQRIETLGNVDLTEPLDVIRDSKSDADSASKNSH